MTSPYRSLADNSEPKRRFRWLQWRYVLASVLGIASFEAGEASVSCARSRAERPPMLARLETEATRYMHAVYPGMDVHLACNVGCQVRGCGSNDEGVCTTIIGTRRAMLACAPGEGCREMVP